MVIIRGNPLCVLGFNVVTDTAVASVPLWEDKSLTGFMPLSDQSTYSADDPSQKVCPPFCGLVPITIECLQVCMLWLLNAMCQFIF